MSNEDPDIGGQFSVPAGFFAPPNAIHVPGARDAVASLPSVFLKNGVPTECRTDRDLDLTGRDGLPDMLGNDMFGDCVEVAISRLAQAQCPYGRKPDLELVSGIYRRWTGHDLSADGTIVTDALADLCTNGIQWADQDLYVPYHFAVQRDGEAVDMAQVKVPIARLRGALCTVRFFPEAFSYEGWQMPTGAQGGQHEIALLGYDAAGLYSYTWGRIVPMPYAVFYAISLAVDALVPPAAWLSVRGEDQATILKMRRVSNPNQGTQK